MSARDYHEFHALLPRLIGRKCFLTLAANSLKLHLDENRKRGEFLWIDPPWQFGRAGDEIASSASCPQHDEKNYKQLFREWCSNFEPVNGCVIEQISSSSDGSLWVNLRGGYTFYVPKEYIPTEPPFDWYDHWYLRSINTHLPTNP